VDEKTCSTKGSREADKELMKYLSTVSAHLFLKFSQ